MSADVPIIIDYDKEMTVLVIYSDRENICFYLDRAVQIRPSICFSLFPVEETSNVVLIYPKNTTIDVVDTITEDIKKTAKIILGDLANDLHISVPYLYELFGRHLRFPPGQYIMKINRRK